MKHTILTIFIILAFAFISCSAEESIEVEKLTIKDRINNAYNQIGDKVNSVLHRNQEEVIEPVVEQDRSIKGRLQEGLQTAEGKFAQGRERLSEGFNRAAESIKGKFQSQAEPEPEPVVEEEPSLKEKINRIFANVGSSVETLEDKLKGMLQREKAEEPVEQVEETPEKKGLKERLQDGYDSASGKIKGAFSRGSEAEQAPEQPQEPEEPSLKDRIVNKVMGALHMDDRTLPPKVGEAAESAKETLEHGKAAYEEAKEAANSESLGDKVRHAYNAVKEGVKGLGLVKDTAAETQEVPVEGGKDSLKESLKLAMSKESLKGKYDEAKEFMKQEGRDSVRMVKERIRGKEEEPQPEQVEERDPSFTERFVDALYKASESFKSAIGIHKEEKSSDL